MTQRRTRHGAAVAAALLLPALAACSSGSTPLSAQDKSFVTSVRQAMAQDGTSHAKRSDAQLAAAGDSTCGLMKAGKLSQAYSALKSSGYTLPEIADVEGTAVQTLCTGQRAGYFAWLSTPAQS